MSHEQDLTRPGKKTPRLFYGTVTDGGVTAESDELYVKCPGPDGAIRHWGPCAFAARVNAAGNAYFPDEGDSAWVMFDDSNKPVCVMWSPYG